MNLRNPAFALAAGAFFTVLTAGVPLAQAADSKEAAAPASSEPQTTSAQYEDWNLQCARTQDNVRVCQVVQSFKAQGQQGVYAQLLIAKPGPKDGYRVIFEVMPNVSFPSTVKLAVDDKDTTPVELAWRRCVSGPGCFADADLKDDVLKRWRAQAGLGRLSFKDAAGHDATFNFSFKGLSQAIDGMAKE